MPRLVRLQKPSGQSRLRRVVVGMVPVRFRPASGVQQVETAGSRDGKVAAVSGI